MSTTTKTKPSLDGPSDCWPPLAHIARKKQGTVKPGDKALCGARLMGINLDDAHKVCAKCVEIARKELAR